MQSCSKQFSYEEVMALKKDYERQIERLTIDVETYKRALRELKEKIARDNSGGVMVVSEMESTTEGQEAKG